MTTVVIVLLAIIAVALVFWLWAIAPRMWRRPDWGSMKNFDYAHRGLHDDVLPENSMGAFEAAVSHGCGMEFDLQLTKDKKVVVHHDRSLLRVCGVDKSIGELSYDELKEIKLGDSDYATPLFSDVLKMVDGRVPMIIEIKNYDNISELCSLVWEELKDYKGEYCIESFHPIIVSWFRKHQPQVVRGQLMTKFTGKEENGYPNPALAWLATNLFTNCLARPDFEAYDHRHRANLSLRAARKLYSMQEVSWTVRSKDNFRELKDEGCLCIFEDFEP